MIWQIQEVVVASKVVIGDVWGLCEVQIWWHITNDIVDIFLHWKVTVEWTQSQMMLSGLSSFLFPCFVMFAYSCHPIDVRSAQDPWRLNGSISYRSVVIVSLWFFWFLGLLKIWDALALESLCCCECVFFCFFLLEEVTFAPKWTRLLDFEGALSSAGCCLHLWDSKTVFLDFSLWRRHLWPLWLLNVIPPLQSTDWWIMGQWAVNQGR